MEIWSGPNLFRGYDRELHLIRNRRDRKLFDAVALATLPRLRSEVLPRMIPRGASISDARDYEQEALGYLWAKLPGYRWVCKCKRKFPTLSAFRLHGCCVRPRNPISLYATFVLRRRLKDYRRWHFSAYHDQSTVVVDVSQQYGLAAECPTPEDTMVSKERCDSLTDMLTVETDYRIRFAVESFLDGLSVRDMVKAGVRRGLFANGESGEEWFDSDRIRGTLQLYARICLDDY